MKNNLTKNLQIPLTAIAAILLSACASNTPVEQSTLAAPSAKTLNLKPGQTIATVNGRAIAKSALTQGQQTPASADVEDKMIDELIARELIAQEFTSKDISNDAELQEHLENVLRLTYSQIASERYIKSIKVTDAELRQLYDQKQAELTSHQYKIRHILLENEQSANEAIASLNKGAKFDVLVKKISKDDGTKAQGGDLGWVDPRAMGAEFVRALESVKNGQVATKPVQSQYGWHVILVEDNRTQPAPAFDAIKDKLTTALRMEKFQQHIQELKAKATINKNRVASTTAPQQKQSAKN